MTIPLITAAERRARRLAAETHAAAEVIRDVLRRDWDDAVRLASLLTAQELEDVLSERNHPNACVRVAAVIYTAQVQTGDPLRDADAKVHSAVIDETALLYHDAAVPSRQGPREWRDPLLGATPDGEEQPE